MEYAQIVFAVIVYLVVARWEWASASRNSKSPFLHVAFWPVWLAVYVMILGIMAAIAAVWVLATFFVEIFKAFKQA